MAEWTFHPFSYQKSIKERRGKKQTPPRRHEKLCTNMDRKRQGGDPTEPWKGSEVGVTPAAKIGCGCENPRQERWTLRSLGPSCTLLFCNHGRPEVSSVKLHQKWTILGDSGHRERQERAPPLKTGTLVKATHRSTGRPPPL